MDLSYNSKMETYYQKFFELQERLRKSEEERLKLEMRFNELVQISREEEQTHYKKLRSQYKKFLEEDRKRQERNEKIVRTLERIESRVNMLTSKSDRFKQLRHQYQSYLQRVAQTPVAKQEYTPPKLTEELPSNGFDYDKKSSDIAMLKKAYGKTNDEKIEILDKYLQNLKLQKDQTMTESKPKENKTEFNFDEVSKKLNEGFNSNKANSIAEDIMNSIYARHYKTDLFKDDTKKVGKYTYPSSTSRYPDKERYSGFGDQHIDSRTNPSVDLYSNKSNMNVDSSLRQHDTNKLTQKPYTFSNSFAKGLQTVEEGKARQVNFGKAYEDTLKNSLDLSPNQSFNENKAFPRDISGKMYQNDNGIDAQHYENNNLHGPSKTDTDHNESEKKLTQNNPIIGENSGEALVSANNNMNNATNSFIRNDSVNTNKDELINEVEEYDNHDNEMEREFENTIDLPNNETNEPTAADSSQEEHLPNIDGGSLMNETVIEKHEEEGNESTQQSEEKPETNDIINDTKDKHDPVQYKQNEFDGQVTYDESGQPYDHNDQVYEEGVQPYEQMEQYDSNEQLYGENGKALLQYDENGHAIDDQEYNEDQTDQNVFEDNNEVCNKDDQQSQNYDGNGEIVQRGNENVQHIQHGENGESVLQSDENGKLTEQCDEKDQPIQQYDESGLPIEPYGENGHPTQQYDENIQPIQQYDENGQLIQQQYDENAQPVQHYDENGQLLQQYDENGQPLQQYDESGQPIQQYVEDSQPVEQYDENGQPLQQYDENGQLIQQYDENGQPLQQYDENGQPIYFNQGDGLIQYDESGQIIQQYDDNGQPIIPNMCGESYQQYDSNGQPIAEYEAQLGKQLDENAQPIQEYETSVDQQEQNKQSDVGEGNGAKENENVDQPSKKNNVLDLLDTDSESVKQNTSKISNDSDFDFSNG